MPVYPKLADMARISGSLTATVVLGPDGSIEKTLIDIGTASTTARQLFPPEVEKALRASAFRKACGGKSVTLVFSFVLGEELDPQGLPQRVSFGYPNRFSISVPPKIVQP
jgi:outer membrane biosynthesis protein TonB